MVTHVELLRFRIRYLLKTFFFLEHALELHLILLRKK
jgi:hypothetical protein